MSCCREFLRNRFTQETKTVGSTQSSTSYTWDSNGNLKSKTLGESQTTFYGWNSDQRLINVKQGTSEATAITVAQYSYDVDGNTDMGTRVSVATGDGSEGAQNPRLYLMKIRRELWEEDERAVAEKHEGIAAQMRGDRGLPAAGADNSNRYSRGENRNLFTPRRAK